MTIFGPDISSYQAGLDLSRLTDASFVIAKVAEGTYYADADYNGWRLQAEHLGLPFVAYDFVRADEAPAAQATWIAAHIVEPSLPLMLDVEPEGTSKPTFPQVVALAEACAAMGLNPRLAYIPRWYWEQIGSPDMTGLNALGVWLVASSYPGGSGTAAQLYPGDGAPGWAPYGGVSPLLYQYTDRAADGGQLVDFNAFRGSVAQLRSYLGVSSPTISGGTDVTPQEHNWVDNLYAGMFLGGPSCGRDTPAGRNDLFAHVDYMTSLLEGLSGRPAGAPPVDVAALASALGPLLHPSTDVAALATALGQHIGIPDAGAFAAALAAHIKVV